MVNLFILSFKRLPGWGANPGSFVSFIFSFHHFTAEPQRLPIDSSNYQFKTKPFRSRYEPLSSGFLMLHVAPKILDGSIHSSLSLPTSPPSAILAFRSSSALMTVSPKLSRSTMVSCDGVLGEIKR
jgi:hypothetical protein